MKTIRRVVITSLLLLMITVNCVPVLANENYSSVCIDEMGNTYLKKEVEIKYVTPDEMEALINAAKSDVALMDNLFADIVYFTLSRNDDGSAKCVFMKGGFLFDRCDLSGVIRLYNSSGGLVAKHSVYEKKLITNAARVHTIYPVGGEFEYAEYELTVSDGGEVATAYGIKYPQ